MLLFLWLLSSDLKKVSGIHTLLRSVIVRYLHIYLNLSNNSHRQVLDINHQNFLDLSNNYDQWPCGVIMRNRWGRLWDNNWDMFNSSLFFCWGMYTWSCHRCCWTGACKKIVNNSCHCSGCIGGWVLVRWVGVREVEDKKQWWQLGNSDWCLYMELVLNQSKGSWVD